MDKAYLVESAKQLKRISKEASEEYYQKKDILVSMINESMLARDDIFNLIGTNNIQLMKDNHTNHTLFMYAIFQNYNIDVLIDTIVWVFRSYSSHGFAATYWSAQLNLWIAVSKKNLCKETFTEIYPYYEWMIINIPIFTKLSSTDTENIKLP